jgi:AcrR family transcriptional regulator
MSRDAIPVLQIAAHAGVTRTAVYRRWGDLRTLLSDVAGQQLHPNNTPADTGALQSVVAPVTYRLLLDDVPLYATFAHTRVTLLLETRGGSISSSHT